MGSYTVYYTDFKFLFAMIICFKKNKTYFLLSDVQLYFFIVTTLILRCHAFDAVK